MSWIPKSFAAVGTCGAHRQQALHRVVCQGVRGLRHTAVAAGDGQDVFRLQPVRLLQRDRHLLIRLETPLQQIPHHCRAPGTPPAPPVMRRPVFRTSTASCYDQAVVSFASSAECVWPVCRRLRAARRGWLPLGGRADAQLGQVQRRSPGAPPAKPDAEQSIWLKMGIDTSARLESPTPALYGPFCCRYCTAMCLISVMMFHGPD